VGAEAEAPVDQAAAVEGAGDQADQEEDQADQAVEGEAEQEGG
jgi:hypothetical protein